MPSSGLLVHIFSCLFLKPGCFLRIKTNRTVIIYSFSALFSRKEVGARVVPASKSRDQNKSNFCSHVTSKFLYPKATDFKFNDETVLHKRSRKAGGVRGKMITLLHPVQCNLSNLDTVETRERKASNRFVYMYCS